MTRFLLFALLTPCLACGDPPSPDPEPDPPAQAVTDTPPVEARMENGVQVVEITVGPTGYHPAHIALEAGVPARLVFTRTAEGDCAEQVRSPDLGIAETDLPLDAPSAIEFTPATSGSFGFTCGMGMLEGAVLVRS